MATHQPHSPQRSISNSAQRVKAAGFKINAEKTFFTRDNLEYLGFKITRLGIIPLPDKVKAIKDIAVDIHSCRIG